MEDRAERRAEWAETMGRHGAEITQLRGDVAEMRADLRAIRETLAEARGGWKAIMVVAGFSGTLGAALMKLATKLGVM
jgi:hypothetical protein